MEWNDVASICTTRIWKKWHLYDPSRPLENWCNALISNELKNLKRDLHGRFSRPCVGGGKANGSSCVHNLGGNTCEITKSRTQCAECPLYREWEKTRRYVFNIKSTVALENHAQEVSNMPEEHFDSDAVQKALHAEMRANLTQWEWHVYHGLYILHLKPNAVSERLQAIIKTWKRAPRTDEQWSYQFILDKQHWFRELMMEALKRQGYDLERALAYAD
jgi:hypothetical protein